MMEKLFLPLVFYFVLVIMFVMDLNAAKPKKNIIMGATIPVSHQNDEKVVSRVKQFKKELIALFVIFTLLIIPAFFMSLSASMAYTLIWLVVVLFLMNIPHMRANVDLKKYKAEAGIITNKRSVADLKLSLDSVKTVSPLYSLAAVVISILPIIYLFVSVPVAEALKAVAAPAIITVAIILVMILHIIINKRAKDVVGEDTELNRALSVLRTSLWATVFIGTNLCAAFINCVMVADFLNLIGPNVSFALIAALSAVMIIIAIASEFRARHKQEELTKNMQDDLEPVDQDDYWPFDLVYYNKNDRRVTVPDRIGGNSTVNAATVPGKIIIILTALILCAIPFLGIYVYKADQTPMTVEFTGDAVIATHMSREMEIPNREIISRTKLEKAPELTGRVKGFSTENCRKGIFTTKDYGTCEVFFSKKAKDFYLVKTKDTTYILGVE